METDKLIKAYIKKARKLAILKSALCGIVFGFALDFILAFILWFVNIELVALLLISIGLGSVGAIAIGLLMYFIRFKPTTKTVAKMIDKLGLEERVITMYEMENVDSNIAKFQREDAKKKIGSVSPRQFGFQASKAVIILLAVFATLGISMTTVSALSTVGALTPGSELIKPKDPDKGSDEKPEELVYFEVNYIAGDNGTISGETHQRVAEGKDATPVVAVPDEGYIFVQWDDGQMNADRWDWGVIKDITVTAIFQKKAENDGNKGDDGDQGEEGKNGENGEGKGEGNKGDDGENGDGEGDGDGEGEGDGGEGQGGDGENGESKPGQGAQGAKGDGGETQSQGGQGQGGKPQGGKDDGKAEGEGGAQVGDGEKGEGNGKTEQEGGNGSGDGGNQQGQGGEGGHGGEHDSQNSPSSKGDGGGAGKGKQDNNTIMDGATNYKDAGDYEQSKENVENDDSLPPELKDALGNFFDGMKP